MGFFSVNSIVFLGDAITLESRSSILGEVLCRRKERDEQRMELAEVKQVQISRHRQTSSESLLGYLWQVT
jgi:hypothetical protein